MSDDKTFAPTPRRRERARRAGQLPRGRDLTAIAVILSGLAALLCVGPWWFRSLGELWVTLLPQTPDVSLSPDQAVADFRRTLWLAATTVLPAMGLFVGVAVISQWAQVGSHFLPEKVTPDFTRVNPFIRVASPLDLLRWSDGLLVLIRYAVGLCVGIGSLWILRAWTGPGPEQASLMFGRAAQTGVAIVFHATVGLAVVAIVEYGYRWWRHESDLYMTAAEAREDLREQEGDLRVRSLRRGVHQQLANRSPKTKTVEDESSLGA